MQNYCYCQCVSSTREYCAHAKEREEGEAAGEGVTKGSQRMSRGSNCLCRDGADTPIVRVH